MNHFRKFVVWWLWIFIVAAAVNSCVSVPQENWMISHRYPLEIKKQAIDCAVMEPKLAGVVRQDQPLETSAQMTQEYGLDANGFRFTTWNIKKGKTVGWREDFERLCRYTDIIILQEAYLTDNLKDVLRQQQLQWDLSTAYEYKKIEAGVLTASRITPNLTCTLKVKEPITRIPKGILITRYPISGTLEGLLVANIHAINFTLGYASFQKQSDRLESMLSAHRGPMIVSGDFNTWNKGRMSRLEAMAQRLNLSPVPFKDKVKSKFLGRDVDHVYYRGLETIKKTTFNATTSDHNPLVVEFKVAEQSKRQGA